MRWNRARSGRLDLRAGEPSRRQEGAVASPRTTADRDMMPNADPSAGAMVNVDRRNFNSAKDAFDALDADSVPFARLAKQKLTQLGTALSTLDKWSRPGGYFRAPRGCSLSRLMSEFLTNGRLARLSKKSWKCVKIKNADDVCFYSDAYHFELERATKLESVCLSAGLEIRIFEWDYPQREFDQDDRPPSTTARIMGGGYKQLYRGKLVGFVVGAYNNPWEKSKKKRQREQAESPSVPAPQSNTND